MKYEITEEQIKELAKGNAKVERWFPEAFETKLEVGKWYKVLYTGHQISNSRTENSEIGDFVFIIDDKNESIKDNIRFKHHSCINLLYSSNVLCYGIDGYTKLFNASGKNESFSPATESEVFEALKKEAVKRGFKIGIRANGSVFGNGWYHNNLIAEGDFEFHINSNASFYNILFLGHHAIFRDGKWAEIIKEKTLSKSEAEKLINELKNDDYTYKIL